MIRTCAYCGRKVEAKRVGCAVLCSDECRRKRHNEQSRTWSAANRKRVMFRTCACCGREFETKGRLGLVALCSDECRRKRRSELFSIHYADAATREAMRERQRGYYAANRDRARARQEVSRKLRKEWRNSQVP
jgi:hypothetical protein